MVATLLAVQIDAHPKLPTVQSGQVLAYASNMSPSGLLQATNAARVANGLESLQVDSRLNNSAQMKAQHMADNDYWAHVAPDGTQPWYFFQAAGYSYTRAGENLAYGFMTSQSTVDGWMGSPSHRTNILGDYVNVGFGIINVANYQGNGNETIVVAHYGSPISYSPPAPATPATPSAQPVDPPAATSPVTQPAASQPTTQNATEASPVTAQPIDQQTKPSPINPDQSAPARNQKTDTTTQAALATGSPKSISLLDLISQKRAPLSALIAVSVTFVTAAAYALTHRRAFQQALVTGEHFTAKHPTIDVAIIAAVSALILLTSYGRIG